MTSPVNEGQLRHRGSRLRTVLSTASFPNASVRSLLSHIFSHSWQIPSGAYPISDLCTYIERTPTAHINTLKWCKDRTGVPHEFLVLQIESLRNKKIWLRIERRPQRSAPFVRLLSSSAPSDDSVSTLCVPMHRYVDTNKADEISGRFAQAKLSANLEPLFNESKNEVKVDTKFTDPPSLKSLGSLLSILREESHTYTLFPVRVSLHLNVFYS